jgi:hypothetical protein
MLHLRCVGRNVWSLHGDGETRRVARRIHDRWGEKMASEEHHWTTAMQVQGDDFKYVCVSSLRLV